MNNFHLRTAALVVFLASLAVTAHAATLAGSEWSLVDDADRYVAFKSGGKLSGFAGCNRFSGSYSAARNQITVGALATTRKFCGRETMAAERAFLALLGRAAKYRVTHTTLMLQTADRDTIAELRRRDWD